MFAIDAALPHPYPPDCEAEFPSPPQKFMASHTTFSQVPGKDAGELKAQLAEWCSDWAAESGMSLLGKIYLQTLLSHWAEIGMSLGDIQRQLGTTAAAIGELGKKQSPVDPAPPVVKEPPAKEPAVEQPAAKVAQEELPLAEEPAVEQPIEEEATAS
jgi:hypothetical protein